MSKYVTLLANTNYPNNNNSQFTTELDEPLELQFKYEVAVIDFYYPVNYLINFGSIRVQYNSILDETDQIKKLKIIKKIKDSIDEENITIEEAIEKFKLNLSKDEIIILKSSNSILKKFNLECDDFFKNLKLLSLNFERKNLSKILGNCNSFINIYNETELIIDKNIIKYNQFYDLEEIISMLDNCIKAIKSFLDLENVKKEFKDQNIIENYKKNILNIISKYQDLSKKLIYIDLSEKKVDENLEFYLEDRINISDFFEKIQNLLSKYAACSKKGNIIEINMKNKVDSITFDEKFKNYCISFKEYDNKINFKINKLIQYVKNFYISTDIICDELISTSKAPVLKIIKPQGLINDYIENNYDRPQYIPVNKTYINKIQIRITDQNKDLIKFSNTDSIIVKLHFRKRK